MAPAVRDARRVLHAVSDLVTAWSGRRPLLRLAVQMLEQQFRPRQGFLIGFDMIDPVRGHDRDRAEQITKAGQSRGIEGQHRTIADHGKGFEHAIATVLMEHDNA